MLSYLNSETESKLLRVLEEEVLEKSEAALLEKEVSQIKLNQVTRTDRQTDTM